MKFQLCFHVDTPLSDILSYHRDLAYHCSLLRPHLRFCRHHKSRKVTVGELVYFWLLQRHESVSKIDSLLTGEVIKFERFRRRRSRLPTYCVFCDQSALLRLCTGGQLSRNISLHSLSLFLSLTLCLSLALRSATSRVCVLQFLLLSLLLDCDRCRHWSRPGFMDAMLFSRQEMPRPILLAQDREAAGTLSRALASSIGIINYRQDCAGPVSLWIIGADAWHHKWLPKKRSNRVSVDVRIRCFKQNARAIYRRMFLLSVWSKKWNVLYFIHLDYITNSIKILSVVQLNEILSCDYRRWEEIRWSSKVTSFNFL